MRKVVIERQYHPLLEDVFYLSESEWRGLLARFNLKRVRKTAFGYAIRVPCCLCEEYDNCNACPVHETSWNCVALLRHFSGRRLTASSIDNGGDELSWTFENDVIVQEGIQMIRRALLALPRVRKRA